jgi:uncharacterized protein (TIGR02147 family)
MVYVFDYLDFRKFLKDYFKENKVHCPFFSYKYFARKAGFNNKGFMYNIINGSKRLSTSNVLKLCSAIGLDKKEREYFQNLVAFNQAESPLERDHIFKQMETLTVPSRRPAQVRTVRRDQYELYSKWYHSALRALAGMNKEKKESAWFARRLFPAIKGREARRSLELLVRLGLLRKTDAGVYKLGDPVISTGHEVKNTALLNFYLQHLVLASSALKTLPATKRRFEGITLGISWKSYEKICAEFESFVEKACSIAAEDSDADMVYQCMLQLYPLSKNVITRGGPDE